MKTINRNKIFLIFILLFILFILLKDELKTSDFVQVSFLDVGQGDAIYIEAFDKTDMLIDGGRNGEVLLERLGNVSGNFDNYIDVLVVTHPDEDHSGGVVSLLREYEIGTLFISGNISDNQNYNQILKLADVRNIPTFLARAGEKIYLDRNKKVYFEIIYPLGESSFVESNRSSISGRLVYGKNEFMLTGDAYVEDEELMIENYKDIEADVLKLGHHGSKTSTSIGFLKAVDPEVAIVSASKTNTYGHPNKEVIDRVSNLGIDILSTVDLGTITFMSDGEKIYLDN